MAALGSLRAKAAVPALIEALKHKDYDVRGNAAEALGSIGADARAAIAALSEALNDANPIHPQANEALRGIVGESDSQP